MRRVAASLPCARPRRGSGRHRLSRRPLQAAGVVDSSALARRLVEAFPTSRDDAIDRNVAVYMAAGGLRALKTAICYNFSLDQG